MAVQLSYTDNNLEEKAISLLDQNIELKIVVNDASKIRWFTWYLPFLLDTTSEKQPLLKSLYCLYQLRKIHAVFGTALEHNKYNLSYEKVSDSEFYLIFTPN